MSSNEEALIYFQKVLAHERAMVHKMQEIIHAVRDIEIKAPLEDVFREETRHNSFAVLLYSILQGVSQEEVQAYVFVRQLLDAILPREGQEKRRYIREPVLGAIRMVDAENAFRYEVKCMDVSIGGCGIETDRQIPAGHTFRLEIDLYGRPVPMSRTGKLIWLKEVVEGTFFGGIQFTSD